MGILHFNANKVTKELIQWIKDWFEENGQDCNAVVGISGGIDSSTVAALCVKALGKDRVVGILMPNHVQNDINYAHKLCKFLGIKKHLVNVGSAIDHLIYDIRTNIDSEISIQTEQNLPPRMRMVTLYAIAQSMNGRVMGTCNLSENYIGYFTKYGDGASDCEPIGSFTKEEVRQIASELELPTELITKVPDDGLPNSTPDEQKFGFTYQELDTYLRTGVIENIDHQLLIETLHNQNAFKLKPVSTFQYGNFIFN